MTVPAFDASRYAADPLPPRLLAVAAAAVEMREADMAYGDNPTRETLLRRVSANIAFDAAARGVLFQVAKLRAGKVGLIVADGLERFDEETYRTFEAAAASAGLQFVVGRVGQGELAVRTLPETEGKEA